MKIIVLPGDGIGPEITAATTMVLQRASDRFGLGLAVPHWGDEQLIDSMAALLVRDAARYDVVVTTNMFGDILSDEAAELSGSLGLGDAINASDIRCMAQAQHGSAPDIAGQDKANPVSLILSAAMLLEWRAIKDGREDFTAASRAIQAAVDTLLGDVSRRTSDLGGALGTQAFARAVCAAL